jgi:glycosyltransferase involved in cell wall biosynthesis
MLNLPKISIVTPSFNQGEFLEECIDSVLSQNYPNLEYVVMDGGSSDNSEAIIRKYEKYLTYWQSKPDGGQYRAIDDGFRRTTGEIMAWLNSDDKYHHHAFFKVAWLFSRCEKIEWLTGRHSYWGKSGELLDVYAGDLPRFDRAGHLNGQYMQISIQQESTFWRRSLWERAGNCLRSDLDYAGDLELWTRFYRFAPLHVADHLLGGYRKHGNQKAVLHHDRYLAEAERVIAAEKELLANNEFVELLPAPSPIRVSYGEFTAYLEDVYADHPGHHYRHGDSSDHVIDSLVQRLVEMRRTLAYSRLRRFKRALFGLVLSICSPKMQASLLKFRSRLDEMKKMS